MSLETNHADVPAHYPYVTRSILRLLDAGRLSNVVSVDIEPRYGYTTRLTYADGSHRITYGNDLGLNTGASCDLSKDKGHSKFMLRTMGIKCPKGDEFLLPWWAERIGPSQLSKGNTQLRTVSEAPTYIDQELGYPAYVKPVDGSKGSMIYVVSTCTELQDVFDLYEEKKVRVALVEEPINMPDYRVVVLDGELISAYERIPLRVVGDGVSTIRQLIENLQQQYVIEGRDTLLDATDDRITKYLARKALTINSVPNRNDIVTLVHVSNLSAGGTSIDITQLVHPHWANLAARVAKGFNLRLLGLDLACEDITDPEADYSVIEPNAAPGLDHYASSGDAQKEIVDDLYTSVLNTMSTSKS